MEAIRSALQHRQHGGRVTCCRPLLNCDDSQGRSSIFLHSLEGQMRAVAWVLNWRMRAMSRARIARPTATWYCVVVIVDCRLRGQRGSMASMATGGRGMGWLVLASGTWCVRE